MTTAARVYVQVEEVYAAFVDTTMIKRVAIAAMERELIEGPRTLTLTVTGDDALRELNRDFRGADRVTDVLSFGADGARNGIVPEPDEDFLLAPDEKPTLGDIAISYPQAKRQAEAAGRPVLHEIALLTAHGALHLMGFDHSDPEEEEVMFAKTDRILAKVLGPSAVLRTPVLDDVPLSVERG